MLGSVVMEEMWQRGGRLHTKVREENVAKREKIDKKDEKEKLEREKRRYKKYIIRGEKNTREKYMKDKLISYREIYKKIWERKGRCRNN